MIRKTRNRKTKENKKDKKQRNGFFSKLSKVALTFGGAGLTIEASGTEIYEHIQNETLITIIEVTKYVCYVLAVLIQLKKSQKTEENEQQSN